MFIYLVILVISLYLLAIMPKITSRPDFNPFKDRYYAHRGLYNNNSNAPENSMKAFERAIEEDYGIELDVRLTKDNVPIVFHDKSLKRVCGIDRMVEDVAYEDLKLLKLFKSDKNIPLFKDILQFVNGRVPLIVEIKGPSDNLKICEITSTLLDEYKGVYCIESFDPLIINWYKKNRPRVIRGQLSSNYFKRELEKNIVMNFILQNMLLNFYSKPNFIAFNHHYADMLSYNIIRNLYRTPTFAYTIRSQKDLVKNRNLFDYFIFEGFRPRDSRKS